MEAWVDDGYAAMANGTSVTWPQGTVSSVTHIIGTDAFASVQGALDALNPYGTVRVAPGEYPENIAVEKPCTIIGPNAGKAGSDPTRGAEAVLMPGVDDPYYGQIMYLRNSGISVDGFLFDGHNPALGGEETIGGVQVNTFAAMQNSWFWWQETWARIDHITIANNVIRNIFYDGVYWDVGLGSNDSYNYITNNLFNNVWEGVQTYGPHTMIADNTVTNVTRGFSLHGTTGAADAGFAPAVVRNQITIRDPADWMDFRGVGIWINYRRENAAAIEVAQNTIVFSKLVPEGKVGYGLWALTVDSGRSVAFRDNYVTGNGRRTIGFLGSSIEAGANVSVTGGELNNSGFGVFAGRRDLQWGDGPARITLTNVTINPRIGGTGVVSTVTTLAGDWSQIELAGNTTITGGAVSVACLGGTAHILFTGSSPASLVAPTANYVLLGSNGVTPAATYIDARQVSFDGVVGTAMTQAQVTVAEGKIVDWVDNKALGLVYINNQPWLSMGQGPLLSAIGVPGQSCTVQASTNFVNWTDIHTATLPFTFSDPAFGSMPYRFYRTATP